MFNNKRCKVSIFLQFTQLVFSTYSYDLLFVTENRLNTNNSPNPRFGDLGEIGDLGEMGDFLLCFFVFAVCKVVN